ncbi:MAG TPA: ADP-ribosylglycohydrolase family protein [Actinomycetales bacterium]|nr:ADP-ribosylglycohydrolase family protein [Actinomycetales bacterium]
MHDVLDPRDLVPDEAEQLALSGFPVGSLLSAARRAANASDLSSLRTISEKLGALSRADGWKYDEPDDEQVLVRQLAQVPPIPHDLASLDGRIAGAWLGRTVGNTMGKPVEGLTRTEVEVYLRAAGQWPQRGYLPLLDPLPPGVASLHPSAPYSCAGRFETVPRDDDIDWTILALHLLETHGPSLTTEHIAAAWLDRVPFTQTYTAERAAYRNLIHGYRPPRTATVDNPYREWIGALIRADAFGYVLPGRPGQAARLALTDARLSHTANGLYGELWSAALTSAALAVDTVRAALHSALEVVPPGSRLAEAVATTLSLHGTGCTVEEALDWVDAALGGYPWVHTINNAALIAIGLLWGQDFTDAIAITISGGRDTDSNAATVGSVFGALHGADSIPAALVGTTHVRVRSAVRDFDGIRISELAERALTVARRFADRSAFPA